MNRMNRIRALAVVVISVVLLLVMAPTASAITFGTIDEEHVNVGAIIVNFPDPEIGMIQWCSGTLIHPRVFLTAGHCTDALEFYGIDAEDVWVSFATYMWDGPFLEIQEYRTHPDYWWGPTSDPHDLGVLIFKEPVDDLPFANLPDPGYLDELWAQDKLRGAKFEVVGYGVNESFEQDGYRKVAYSEFLALLDAWLFMSQNPWTDDSGTCYGDSGGPTFWTDEDGTEVLVAVTSWGDAMCWATGNNYRVDLDSSLEFINAVIAEVEAQASE